jgi:hypothetical protein
MLCIFGDECTVKVNNGSRTAKTCLPLLQDGEYVSDEQSYQTNPVEGPVNFYQTTRRQNSEHSHRHTRRRENLTSHHVCWDVAPLGLQTAAIFRLII